MEEENDEPTVRSERYSLMEDEDWRIRGGSIWNNTQERTTNRVKCRATTCQLVQLVKFMEKHPQLAVAHARPFPGSDELWMKLADHINQFGPPKNYKQCKTTWRDLRKRAYAMQRSRNKKGTGRNLYGMAPKIISLITQAGISSKYKENDEGGASSSKPDTPPPQREPFPVATTSQTANDTNATGNTNKGEQLVVIRVTDKLDSKRNVFNRFTTSDGHFENVIVKEEMLGKYGQEEEDELEAEVEDEAQEAEETFPQPEAILGTTDEVMEEKNSVIRDLNDTLRKFLVEYKTRNALMRERIDLERARLQFDMEVYRSRQMEKRVIAVNAANVMNANAISVANSGSVNNITVGSAGNVGNAANVITVNASAANVVTTASGVKPNPIITLNPLSTGSSGNGIAVKIDNKLSVRNGNTSNAANVINVAQVAQTENAAKAVVDDKAEVEDTMDET